MCGKTVFPNSIIWHLNWLRLRCLQRPNVKYTSLLLVLVNTRVYARAHSHTQEKQRSVVINVMTIHTKWKSKSEMEKEKPGWNMGQCVPAQSEQHCRAICRLSVYV